MDGMTSFVGMKGREYANLACMAWVPKKFSRYERPHSMDGTRLRSRRMQAWKGILIGQEGVPGGYGRDGLSSRRDGMLGGKRWNVGMGGLP